MPFRRVPISTRLLRLCLALACAAPVVSAHAQDTGRRMPRVTGMSVDDALSRLRGLDVSVRVDTVGGGGGPLTVVRQRPSPGTALGDLDVVLTAQAAPPVTVPNVIGQTDLGATLSLGLAHLSMATAFEVNEGAQPGRIFRQDPEAGSTVPRGTVVRVVIARGPPSTVPDLAGMTREQAQAALAEAGFRLGRVDSTRSDRPAGTVVSQSPTAGRQAERGSSVRIRLAFVARPRPVVPDLTGMTRGQAQATLEAAGLALGSVDSTRSDRPSGTVLSQSPGAGRQADPGTRVKVRLAYAPRGQGVAVPDLSGMTPTAAVAVLTRVRLVLGRVDSAAAPGVATGTIFRQSPAAGTLVAPRTPISVTFASLRLVAVPSLVALAQPQARDALRRAGLAAGRVATREAPGAADRALEQSPAAGTRVSPGTAVSFAVSAVLVAVPDVGGRPVAEAREILVRAGLVAALPAGAADGTVAAQAPAAGTRVPRGSRVRLTLQLAPVDSTQVPPVVGQTLRDAATALRVARLVTTVPPGFGDSLRWIVSAQHPAAGARVPVSAEVQLSVQPPQAVSDLVSVPALVGRPLGEASAALTGVLLTASVDPAFADSATWVVALQQPAAGAQVARGTEIRLELSPPPIAVPDLSGLSLAAARDTLAGAGLALAVGGARADTARATIRAQAPAAGMRVGRGAVIRVTLQPPQSHIPWRALIALVVVVAIAVAAWVGARLFRRPRGRRGPKPPAATRPRVVVTAAPVAVSSSGDVAGPGRARIVVREGAASPAAAPAEPVAGQARVRIRVAGGEAAPAEAPGDDVAAANRVRIRIAPAEPEIAFAGDEPLITAGR
jgi:beta-lactam-binding protein with PASTA domain